MSSRARIVLLCFVALVWLNQAAIVEGLVPGPAPSPLLEGAAAGPYPFLSLYRVGGDERLYFAVSGAVLGRPFDVSVLEHGRGEIPAAFAAVTPVEGRANRPYRDVALEYPPANLPFLLLPRLVSSSFGSYVALFGALMGGLMVAAILVSARLRGRLGEGVLGEKHGLLVASVLLLAHGSIAIQRLDAIPALLVVLLVASTIRRQHAAQGVWAGLLLATKILPVLLLPALLVIDHRHTQRGRREWARLGGGLVLSTTVGLGFVVVAPEAIPQIFGYHGARGLHVESTFGLLLEAAGALAGSPQAMHYDYGSINLTSPTASFLAKCAFPLTAIGIGALVWLLRRASDSAPPRAVELEERWRARRLVVSAYAVVVTLWLTGKVFSPQYLTWGIPLAIAVWGHDRRKVLGLTAGALLVSQVYLRMFYGDVIDQSTLGLALLLARQSLLAALLVVLVRMACGGPRVVFHRAAVEQPASSGG